MIYFLTLFLLITNQAFAIECVTEHNQYKYGTKEVEIIRKTNILKYFKEYEEAISYAKENNISLDNILKETNIGGYYVALYIDKNSFVCTYISDDN